MTGISKTHWFLALKIAISVALLYLLFHFVDVGDAAKAAIGANFVLLALAGLVRLSIFALDALRLHWMEPVPAFAYVQHLRLALRGAFFSQLGFGFLTGDAYRAVGYAKGGGTLAQPAAHLLAARLAGISTTALFALLSAFYLMAGDTGALRSFAQRMGIGVFIAAIIVGLLLWLVLKVLPKFTSAANRERLGHGLAALRRLNFRIWALSIFVVLARGFSLWLVFAALHQPLSYAVALLASVTATLVTLIPLAFGGLGLREGTLAGVATLFGAPAAISVSAAILLRLAIVSAASIGLLISALLPEAEAPAGEKQ